MTLDVAQLAFHILEHIAGGLSVILVVDKVLLELAGVAVEPRLLFVHAVKHLDGLLDNACIGVFAHDFLGHLAVLRVPLFLDFAVVLVANGLVDRVALCVVVRLKLRTLLVGKAHRFLGRIAAADEALDRSVV